MMFKWTSGANPYRINISHTITQCLQTCRVPCWQLGYIATRGLHHISTLPSAWNDCNHDSLDQTTWWQSLGSQSAMSQAQVWHCIRCRQNITVGFLLPYPMEAEESWIDLLHTCVWYPFYIEWGLIWTSISYFQSWSLKTLCCHPSPPWAVHCQSHSQYTCSMADCVISL